MEKSTEFQFMVKYLFNSEKLFEVFSKSWKRFRFYVRENKLNSEREYRLRNTIQLKNGNNV